MRPRRGPLGRLVVAAALVAMTAPSGATDDPAPPIRFAPEREYGPFVFADTDGRVRGLSVDMLERLRVRLGLRIVTLPARPLHEQLAALRRGEADLISSLRPTSERAAYLLFTAPYAQVPAVLVVPRDAAPTATLDALGGRPVAVGRGYAVEAHLRARWPGVAWQPVDDDVAALQGVASGRYAGAVTDAASYAFIAERHRVRGLQPAAEVGYDYALCFAVRRDWPALRDRLDDGIRALGSAERQAVLQRWLSPLQQQQATPPRAARATQLALVLLAVAVVLAVALWRRQRAAATGPGPAAR